VGQIALVSVLARVEVPSACWRLARTGELTAAAATAVSRRFLADCGAGIDPAIFVVMALDEPILEAAVELLPRSASRSADAIQLATALAARRALGAVDEFVCLDHRLREAAAAEGFVLSPR
jgi:predicted nucleic acid-binding protein